MSLPLAASVAHDKPHDNSPLEYASKQYEPSKDFKSSSLHWKKKTF